MANQSKKQWEAKLEEANSVIAAARLLINQLTQAVIELGVCALEGIRPSDRTMYFARKLTEDVLEHGLLPPAGSNIKSSEVPPLPTTPPNINRN